MYTQRTLKVTNDNTQNVHYMYILMYI